MTSPSAPRLAPSADRTSRGTARMVVLMLVLLALTVALTTSTLSPISTPTSTPAPHVSGPVAPATAASATKEAAIRGSYAYPGAGRPAFTAPPTPELRASLPSATSGGFASSIPAGSAPWSTVYDSRNGNFYTSDNAGNTVTVTSAATGAVVKTIPVGASPRGVSLDAALGELFVADISSDNVSVINTTTNSVVATAWGLLSPNYLTVDPANGYLYIANCVGDNVSVLDAATLLAVQPAIPVGTCPNGVQYDPANGDLYVPNWNSANVSVISPSSSVPIKNLATAPLPQQTGYDAATGEVWITSAVGVVTFISGTSQSDLGNTSFPGDLQGAIFDPYTGFMYMPNGSGVIAADAAGEAVSAVFGDLGSDGGTFDPQNGGIYVTDEASNSLVELTNVTDGAVGNFTTPQIGFSGYLQDPAVDPATGELFIPQTNNYVYVYSVTNGAYLGDVDVGDGPVYAAYDPVDGLVFVSTEAGFVGVISPLSLTDIATINVPVACDIFTLTVDTVSGDVYAADPCAGEIYDISIAGFTTVATIPCLSEIGTQIAFDPANQYLYVGTGGLPEIEVISTLNDSQVGILPTPSFFYPTAMAVDPAAGILYAGNGSGTSVLEISTVTNATLGSAGGLAGINNLLFVPSTEEVYAGADGGGEYVFSASGAPLLDEAFFPSGALSGETYDPATGLVYGWVFSASTATSSFVLFDPGPSLTSIRASTGSSSDLGQPVTFTASVSNAVVGPFQTTFLGVPGCRQINGAGLAETCTPAAAGSYTLTVTVSDAGGMYRTTSMPFMVHPAPAVTGVAISPSVSSFDVGQSLSITASVSGGTPGGSFAWSALPAPLGCSPATGPTLSCVPTAPGTALTVTVVWSDGAGVSSAPMVSPALDVELGPVVNAPVASSLLPYAGDSGETVVFHAAYSAPGGVSGFVWSGLPGCASASASTVSCVLGAPGTYAISVALTDLNGGVASSPALNYTVHAAPAVSSVSAGPSAWGLDVGQTLVLSAWTSGGTPGGAFEWSGLTPTLGCTNTTAPALTCVPTAPVATLVAEVRWVDGSGIATPWTASPARTVDPAPALGTLSATPDVVDAGETVLFAVSSTSAGPWSSFSWSGLPGCSSQNVTNLACVASTPGTFQTTILGTDMNGLTATRSVAVTVDPALATPQVTVSASSGVVGETVVFQAWVSGGAAPYSYHWTGLPATCTNESLAQVACTPSSAGSLSVAVEVTDSTGAVATSTAVAVSVQSAPSTSSSSSPSSLDYGALGIAVVALLLALGALLMSMRKGRSSSEGGSAVASSAPTPSPSSSAEPEPAAPSDAAAPTSAEAPVKD